MERAADPDSAGAGEIRAAPRGADSDLVWLWDPRAERLIWASASAERRVGARRLAGLTRSRALRAGANGPATVEGADGLLAGALSAERVALETGALGWRLRLSPRVRPAAPEAAAAAAFDSAETPLAALDADGRVLVANPAFRARCDVARFTPAALAAGQVAAAGGPYRTRAATAPGGAAVWTLEGPGAGAPAGAVSAEALAKIAHDLRSPLTAVLGFAEFLRSAIGRLPPERLRDYLDDLRAATERMRGLADAVVALGANAAGEAAPPLDRIVSEAARLAGPAAAAAGVRLEVEAETGLSLLGDGEALGRAVTNLLDNAIRHGGSGGWVRAEVRDLGPDDGAAVSVSDGGPGLTPAELEEARRAWGRPGPRAEGEPAGGLGLALVDETAASLGGVFEIHTAPGDGFRGTVRLPAGRVLRKSALRM